MQYQTALRELKKFANDPVDPKSVTVGDIISLRIAARSVLNVIAANGDVLNKRSVSIRQDIAYPRTESIRVRIVDFIRKNDKDGKGVPMIDIFREFRISVADMLKHIRQSYGVVSKTTDIKGNATFYYWADTWAELHRKGIERLPKEHTVID